MGDAKTFKKKKKTFDFDGAEELDKERLENPDYLEFRKAKLAEEFISLKKIKKIPN